MIFDEMVETMREERLNNVVFYINEVNQDGRIFYRYGYSDITEVYGESWDCERYIDAAQQLEELIENEKMLDTAMNNMV